ncbi:MAG: hypothetical protein ACOCRK_11900 [bacterium]
MQTTINKESIIQKLKEGDDVKFIELGHEEDMIEDYLENYAHLSEQEQENELFGINSLTRDNAVNIINKIGTHNLMENDNYMEYAKKRIADPEYILNWDGAVDCITDYNANIIRKIQNILN